MMTLEEFVSLEQKRLENFKSHWEKEQKQNPEIHPTKMNVGDWEEHLSLFNEEDEND